jgi:hypothetical protein
MAHRDKCQYGDFASAFGAIRNWRGKGPRWSSGAPLRTANRLFGRSGTRLTDPRQFDILQPTLAGGDGCNSIN